MKHHLKIIITALFLSISLFAQKDLEETITMESEIMGETRELQIILPDNFSKEKSYPVVYVTDGETRTNKVKSITDFIKYAKMMPESIIVGIINIDRKRDFTPTKAVPFSVSGNANNFVLYLEEEVKPFVIKNYGVNHKHILTGHSLGGLLTMYTLLTKPNLFDGYLASDPSFWWDNQFINELAKKKLPNLKGEQQVLFINGREGKPMGEMGITNMEKVLKEFAPKTLDWKVISYPNETHTSVVLKGFYDGLRFIEEDYVSNNINFHPRNVHFVKDKPLMLFCMQENIKGFHYTLNGNEPTEKDSLCTNQILIKEEGVFKYRKSTKRVKSTSAKTIPIKLSNPIKPENIVTINLQKGLTYKYYEGYFNSLTKFKKETPVKKGTVTTSFEIESIAKTSNFAFEYNGYYEVKASGYHYFMTKRGLKIEFSLGKEMLLDYDKSRDENLESSAVVYLEKGFHPIKIKYLGSTKNKKLTLDVYIPNVSKGGPEPMSFSSFFHKK